MSSRSIASKAEMHIDRSSSPSPPLLITLFLCYLAPTHAEVVSIKRKTPSRTSSRPSSANSNAIPSLRELRAQRRKPRTAEDVSLSGQDAASAQLPDGGLGLNLHATMSEVRSSRPLPEPGRKQSSGIYYI